MSTLRYLRPRQMFYFVWRRGIGARKVAPWTGAVRQRPAARISAAAPRAATNPPAADDVSFTFLNETVAFPRSAMDWNPSNTKRLWRYNLHYFDFLGDAARPDEEKQFLLDDWVAANPQGREPAWEPYTTSLRIVNWCRFLATLPPDEVRDSWLRSLYEQARWLERNLELHILANHYFENIKAMLFAGVFFDDATSARWLAVFQRELRAQLREQILADGGHYERTPQYHCVLLEDYLDLQQLSQAAPGVFDAQTDAALANAIRDGSAWLRAVATPDDDIPLFNDSASSTLRPAAIIDRALRQNPALQAAAEPGDVIDLPATGLFGWKRADDYFLIDCGDIGPSYQPGHTHCDFLSYVLMTGGEWLVVDSGVYEYEPGEMRRYVRSTAAHNTVSVNGAEQSELWREFRVGRRAQRLAAAVFKRDGDIVFEGAYRGFFQGSTTAVHHRRATLAQDAAQRFERLRIEDTLTADGAIAAQSFVHLHPDLRATLEGEQIVLWRGAGRIAVLQTENVARVEIGSGWHCPQFGCRQANDVVILHGAGTNTLNFGYTLVRCAAAMPIRDGAGATPGIRSG